jgi:hypothetical protein
MGVAVKVAAGAAWVAATGVTPAGVIPKGVIATTGTWVGVDWALVGTMGEELTVPSVIARVTAPRTTRLVVRVVIKPVHNSRPVFMFNPQVRSVQ